MAAKWQQWMPLYLDRLRGSLFVQAMPDAAFRGYIYLLMAAWETEDCTLPTGNADLAILSGLGVRWKKSAPIILSKFDTVTITDGDTVTVRLRNAVLFELWTEAKRVFDARSASGNRTNKLRSSSPEHSGHRTSHRTADRSGHRSANPHTGTGTVTGTGTGTETETEKQGESAPDGNPLTYDPANTDQAPYDPDANPEENIPDGLSPLRYAIFVLEQASIPASFSLKNKCGEAIAMLVRLERCPIPEATRRMLDRVRSAQECGDTVNGFWFEDCRWKLRETAGVSIEGME